MGGGSNNKRGTTMRKNEPISVCEWCQGTGVPAGRRAAFCDCEQGELLCKNWEALLNAKCDGGCGKRLRDNIPFFVSEDNTRWVCGKCVVKL